VQSIRVVIPDAAATKLAELAERKYRAPRQQAAALLVEAIERASRASRREQADGREGQRTAVASAR